MGFLDKVKKSLGSGKKKDKSKSSDATTYNSSYIEPDDDKNETQQQNLDKESINDSQTLTSKVRNFQYLDDLIHSGTGKIVLDSDIILADGEETKYKNGIEINVDDLIIEGNNYSIDSKGKTRIFKVNSKIKIKDVAFKNGYSVEGGVINNQKEGNIKLIGCEFKQNRAATDGGAILNWGQLILNESKFINNVSNESNGGAISNQKHGSVVIDKCEFTQNQVASYGGAILNWGQLILNESKFKNNISNNGDGGAINNQKSGEVIIDNCEFKENSATSGGAIFNLYSLDIIGSKFESNTSTMTDGAAISNLTNGNISIDKCEFIQNWASNDGGAIINFGKIDIQESGFISNVSERNGAAIANGAIITIYKSNFRKNRARHSGGAIINFGNINLTESNFTNNASKFNGVICSMTGSVLNADECNFKSNEDICIYNESNNVKIISSSFSHNNGMSHIVLNVYNMDIIDCVFKDNEKLDSVILTNNDSRINISGGEISNNQVKKAALHTEAIESSVSDTIFKDNIVSTTDKKVDIFNEAKLSIKAINVADDDSIINNGHIDARKMHHNEIERIIRDFDEDNVDEFNLPSEFRFDFSYLDNMVKKCDNNLLTLNEDISLENYELDFYEGGIEIDMDGLTIDGKGHVIDGKHKTRIFNILGRDVTVKNIIFKNGYLENIFDEHIGGGGAIKIIKSANLTLENCQFIDNVSQDDGGAILNNGMLQSHNNKFTNNISKYNGGAVHNNNIMNSTGDTFENNNSKLAGAIFNNHQLSINERISLMNNSSDIKEDIYNADSIKTEYMSIDIRQIIYNTGTINEDVNDWESFNYLNDRFDDSKLILDKNIKLDFDICDLIFLDNIEFDGNGHIIDLNNFNVNFKIKRNVVIRNLTFKNAFVRKNSLFEVEGNIQFENVKFLNNKIGIDNYLFMNNGELKLIDSNFYNNTCKNNSLIDNNNSLEVINTDFINNNANANGCIIHGNKKKIRIKGSSFKFNSTKKYGGAIYNEALSIIEVFSSKFIKNTSNAGGGAIINFNKVTINESSFICNVSKRRGGAALLNQNGDMSISNCEFEENVAVGYGGAIMNYDQMAMTCSKFIGNISKEREGAAISNLDNGDLTISDCKFMENIAFMDGGAIINLGKLNIWDSSFINNSTKERNGAAIANGGDLTISTCEFRENVAADSGGAIISFGNITLMDSVFKGNSAKGGGGALNAQKGSVDAFDVEFSNNISKNGGAIYSLLEGGLNLKNCTFNDNQPNNIYGNMD